jgi:hypothetical protein
LVVPDGAGDMTAASTAVAVEALAAAEAYARQALAPETRRAYATDWGHFAEWCREAGCSPIPAEPLQRVPYWRAATLLRCAEKSFW